jgi:hypothetical protein
VAAAGQVVARGDAEQLTDLGVARRRHGPWLDRQGRGAEGGDARADLTGQVDRDSAPLAQLGVEVGEVADRRRVDLELLLLELALDRAAGTTPTVVKGFPPSWVVALASTAGETAKGSPVRSSTRISSSSTPTVRAMSQDRRSL